MCPNIESEVKRLENDSKHEQLCSVFPDRQFNKKGEVVSCKRSRRRTEKIFNEMIDEKEQLFDSLKQHKPKPKKRNRRKRRRGPRVLVASYPLN